MTNILKRALSLRTINRENTLFHNQEPADPQNSMQEPNLESTDSLPNFAAAGITDPIAIVKELIQNSPTISLYLGPSSTRHDLPKRLLLYHSPIATHLIPKTEPYTLTLPSIDPDAFFHLDRWMRGESFLNIITPHSSTPHTFVSDNNNSHNNNINLRELQKGCTLLCRIYAAAKYLHISAIQLLILSELRRVFESARGAGMRTPVVASTVMEVWESSSSSSISSPSSSSSSSEHEAGEGEECPCWNLIKEELCTAFLGTPRLVYAEYAACIEAIGPLRVLLAGEMTDRIFGFWGVVKVEGE